MILLLTFQFSVAVCKNLRLFKISNDSSCFSENPNKIHTHTQRARGLIYVSFQHSDEKTMMLWEI